MQEAMLQAERNMFRSYLGKATHYFEFGSGGSTVSAGREPGLQTIYSVESSTEWINKVSAEVPKAKMLYADIGPTGPFGYPSDPSTRSKWPAYSGAWGRRESGVQPDLVLVDGRFRVACILTVLLESEGWNPTVIVHDFWDRPHYHEVLPFFDVVDRVETLAVLKPKQGFDRVEAERMLERYVYDSR